MVTLVRLEHSANASVPMFVTPLPIETLVRVSQLANAMAPMLVTLFGMVRLVRFRFPQKKNAQFAMLVTGRPLIVSGMVTAPSQAHPLVMVIVPLLVS